jgi:hypothetical protein
MATSSPRQLERVHRIADEGATWLTSGRTHANLYYSKCEALMAVTVKSNVIWDVMP